MVNPLVSLFSDVCKDSTAIVNDRQRLLSVNIDLVEALQACQKFIGMGGNILPLGVPAELERMTRAALEKATKDQGDG